MNDLKQNPEQTVAFNGLIKKILSSKMSDSEIEDYILNSGKLLDPIGAKIEFSMLGIDGRFMCTPKDSKDYPYVWDHRVYGFGVADIKCDGNLSTGYADWSGLWKNTTSVGVTCGEIGIGVVAAVFFREDGMPIGDFRGVPTGVLAFAGAGGEGGWNKL